MDIKEHKLRRQVEKGEGVFLKINKFSTTFACMSNSYRPMDFFILK